MFYYHKGLTRQARRTVGTALTMAGRQGCTAADTGYSDRMKRHRAVIKEVWN